MTTWVYNDGGRADAGYRGKTGDCGVRAVAIVTGRTYTDVYHDLDRFCLDYERRRRRGRPSRARTGIAARTMRAYLDRAGFDWHPTMTIGAGCTVHLDAHELPAGRLIVRASRHYVAVIDGTIHDTYDPTRDGTRCVYGYWTPEVAP